MAGAVDRVARIETPRLEALHPVLRIVDDVDRANRRLQVDMMDQGIVPKAHGLRDFGHQVRQGCGVLDRASDSAKILNLPKPDHHMAGAIRTADRQKTRLNSSPSCAPRIPSSACKKKNKQHTI